MSPSGRYRKGRRSEEPKYHVVSVRVSEVELKELERLSRKSRLNLSELLRLALQQLASPRKKAA